MTWRPQWFSNVPEACAPSTGRHPPMQPRQDLTECSEEWHRSGQGPWVTHLPANRGREATGTPWRHLVEDSIQSTGEIRVTADLPREAVLQEPLNERGVWSAPHPPGTCSSGHMLHPLGEKHRAGHTACVLSANPQQPLEAHCSLPVLQMTRLTLSKTKRLARSTELVGGTAGLSDQCS